MSAALLRQYRHVHPRRLRPGIYWTAYEAEKKAKRERRNKARGFPLRRRFKEAEE